MQKEFTRGNVTALFAEDGCWVHMFGDEGEEQTMALEPSEMHLLYMALGDYFASHERHLDKLPPEQQP